MSLTVYQVPDAPFEVHVSQSLAGVPYAITCGLVTVDVPEVVVYVAPGADKDPEVVRNLLGLMGTVAGLVLASCWARGERSPEGLRAPSGLDMRVQGHKGTSRAVRLGLVPKDDRFLHVERRLGVGHRVRVLEVRFPPEYFHMD